MLLMSCFFLKQIFLKKESLYYNGFFAMVSELNEKKREKMLGIVADLKKRMAELDELGEKIKMEGRLVSPEGTRQLLEEIKIPPLKLLKEK